MPSVLVVDDSLVDQRFVGGLLAENPDLQVRYAGHGAEALAMMREAVPDLIVTDLLMPEMDGLELVAAVKQKHPSVPVILMTSQGSEEIATRALQEGAASYVPKTMLARYLTETVRKVIAVSAQDRYGNRLMGYMLKSESCFQLENDPALFVPLITYLQQGLVQMRVCSDPERVRVGIALGEALANALYHGNLEVGSELREYDASACCRLIETRRRQSPYRERRIEVQAKLRRDEATFIVGDAGSGFDHSVLPDPTDPANLEKVGGRGILLMRAFMDRVDFNTAGNVVTLVKSSRNGDRAGA